MPMSAPLAVMICQRPGLKARAWKSRLLVPPPDRGDVVTHGGLVQLEAELALGGVAGRSARGRSRPPARVHRRRARRPPRNRVRTRFQCSLFGHRLKKIWAKTVLPPRPGLIRGALGDGGG